MKSGDELVQNLNRDIWLERVRIFLNSSVTLEGWIMQFGSWYWLSLWEDRN